MAYTTINKSNLHFNTKLYTGDGSSTQAITGVGFQPDLTWIKCRSTGHDHYSFDAVRTNKKGLEPSDTSAERTPTLGSFDTDGFTFASTDGFYNANGDTYVSWNWKANGAGSSNTDGSITSTVSANTTAGFSIVKYTGTGATGTIGHGLGAKPNVIIQKRLDGATAWTVYHDKFDANPSHKYLYLDKSDALADYNLHWNDTEPTSSVITLGSDSSVNGNGNPNIIYAFTEKTGYSKFGSYTGNGSESNAPFCYTGFKPAFTLLKNASLSSTDWQINDGVRNTYNPVNSRLSANTNSVENSSGYRFGDYLSNGFKIREDDQTWNRNGDTYIYMAFAEAPLVGSNNVPCTAR